jgi:hypothetical protein
MPKITDASTFKVGSSSVNKLYVGSNRVWPPVVLPSVASVGAEGTGILGAAAAVPVPSGVVAGSLVVAYSINYNAGSGGVVSGGSGTWRELTSLLGAVPYVRVWWKRATAADSGTYTVSNAGVETVTGAAVRIANDDGSIFPFAQRIMARSASSTTTPNTALSAVSEGSLLLWSAHTGDNTMSQFPENFTGLTSGNRRNHLATKTQALYGSTGNVSGTLNANYASVAALIAIKPLRGPVVAAIGTTAAGTTNSNPTIPEGVVAGSLVVLFGVNGTSSALTPSAGFAEIVSQTADPRQRAWWKRATGPESGTYTVAGNALNNMGAVAVRIANDDGTSAPFGLSTSGVTATGQTLGPPLSLDPVSKDSLLLHSLGPVPSRVITAETDFQMASDTAAAQRIGLAHKTQQVTGPTGTIRGGVTGGTAKITGILLAIKPPPE